MSTDPSPTSTDPSTSCTFSRKARVGPPECNEGGSGDGGAGSDVTGSGSSVTGSGSSAPLAKTFQVTDIPRAPGPWGPGSYPTIAPDRLEGGLGTGPERPKIREEAARRAAGTPSHPDPARPIEPRGPFLYARPGAGRGHVAWYTLWYTPYPPQGG